MSTREKLLAEIEEFCEKHGLKDTAFGLQSVNDPALIMDLRNGRSVRLDTADRLRAFMAAYKPVRRPKKAAASHAAA